MRGSAIAYRIGDIVCGRVTGLQPYGAFVELDAKTQGLVHISELKQGYIEDIHEVIKVGQDLRVVVLDIDPYSEQISLSARALEPAKRHPFSNRRRVPRYGRRRGIGFESIGENLERWMDDEIFYLTQRSELPTSFSKMDVMKTRS